MEYSRRGEAGRGLQGWRIRSGRVRDTQGRRITKTQFVQK